MKGLSLPGGGEGGVKGLSLPVGLRWGVGGGMICRVSHTVHNVKPRGIYVMAPWAFEKVYGSRERAAIAELTATEPVALTADSVRAEPHQLEYADVLFCSWGAPTFDATLLNATPRLQAIFYGAGSVRGLVTDALWARNITVCSAWAANAVPVAEYVQATILLSLKRFWSFAADFKRLRKQPPPPPVGVPGAYGSTVGLVSLGMVGRRVCERLRSSSVRVMAYDPFLSASDATALGVETVPLAQLFRDADVVSLHTPWLKETEGLITGELVASMKPGATLINTSRGAILRERDVVAVLAARPDLTAILDVTDPEPPDPESPLYTLPNVILTPHIAGSMDSECRRMGAAMVDELRRFISGQPLQWRVSREQAAIMA